MTITVRDCSGLWAASHLLVFICVLFAGPGEGPHVVDSVGPRHPDHLPPPVEQEVALLVVVAGLSVKPGGVVCQLRSAQGTWRITVVAVFIVVD